jgi:hypothetical protein
VTRFVILPEADFASERNTARSPRQPATQDVFGTRRVGMKTVLFRRPPDTTGRGETEPDYIIREFGELTQALDYFTAS